HLEPDARQTVVLGLDAGAEIGRALPAGHLGQEDRRLSRLALAVEDRVFTLGRARRPVLEQLAGNGRDAGIAAGPPAVDLEADVVDERVLLSPLAGDVEVEGLLGLLALPRDWHRDERLAGAPSIEHGAGRAVGADLEVLLRRLVGR